MTTHEQIRMTRVVIGAIGWGFLLGTIALVFAALEMILG